MAKLIPIPIIAPTNIYETASQAPISGETSAEKIRALFDHFLAHNLEPIDMREVPRDAANKSFTLRVSPQTLEALNQYCQRTLYTRQQAFQIAICTSLKALGITRYADPERATA